MNNNKKTEKLLQMFEKLPQYNLLDKRNIKLWVERMMNIDEERLPWHIIRLGGIGGSEIGTVLNHFYGGFDARESVPRLVKKKLALITPDPPNADTARGQALEDEIRRIFELILLINKIRFRRRDDLKKIVDASVHAECPWLRASLDDIYELDGKIVLIDYKAPSEKMLETYKRTKDFHSYEAQLNQYWMIAKSAGINIDRMELVMYDYRCLATKGVHRFDVNIIPELHDKIKESSNIFWNEFVMKNVVPENKVNNTNLEIPEHIVEALQRNILLSASIAKLKKDSDIIKQMVNNWLGNNSEVNTATGNIVVKSNNEVIFHIKPKFKINHEEVIKRLISLGCSEVELNDILKKDFIDIDSDKIKDELIEKIRKTLPSEKKLAEKIEKIVSSFEKKYMIKDIVDEEKLIKLSEKYDVNIKDYLEMSSVFRVPTTISTQHIKNSAQKNAEDSLINLSAMLFPNTQTEWLKKPDIDHEYHDDEDGDFPGLEMP